MTTEGMRARRELGKLIKQIREDTRIDGHKLTQGVLGKYIGCTQSKIQKMEAAKVRIDPADVDQIIEFLDIDLATAGEMRRLAELNVASEPWANERARVPRYARQYMEDEQLATEILSWHELRIPGPLQSEQYMLQQFQAAGRTDVTVYIRNRKQRTQLFQQPQLRRYHCVLAEEALHRAASSLGRSTVRDQIDHLLAINDLSDPDLANGQISVQLLSIDAPVVDPPGDFSILHFATRRSFVYIEHIGGAHYLTPTRAVQQAGAAHRSLSRAALDHDGTRKLLQKLREEFART